MAVAAASTRQLHARRVRDGATTRRPTVLMTRRGLSRKRTISNGGARAKAASLKSRAPRQRRVTTAKPANTSSTHTTHTTHTAHSQTGAAKSRKPSRTKATTRGSAKPHKKTSGSAKGRRVASNNAAYAAGKTDPAWLPLQNLSGLLASARAGRASSDAAWLKEERSVYGKKLKAVMREYKNGHSSKYQKQLGALQQRAGRINTQLVSRHLLPSPASSRS
jgi:hypothetical protein